MRTLCAMVVLSLLTGGCARAKETAQEAGHPLHPHFTLTQETLSGMVGDLPSSIQQAILSHPEEFLSLLEQVLPLWEEDPFLFLLVDKAHGLPADYEPDDLISLEGRGLSLAKSGLMLRESVLPDLIRMVEAARKDGVELVVGSCYRSYDRQATIYQWEVETYGKEAADRESARPGHSQHQLGLAVDFSPIENRFADLPAGKWLAEHAAAFGFSLSYPDGYEHLTGYRYEPWHFRYLTPQGTALQDRFFDGIQQYMLEFLNTHRAALRAAWKASAP